MIAYNIKLTVTDSDFLRLVQIFSDWLFPIYEQNTMQWHILNPDFQISQFSSPPTFTKEKSSLNNIVKVESKILYILCIP